MALRSVAVTGGTGFLGSAICRALAERRPDCKIFALDLCPRGKHALPPTVQFAQADITSLEDVCTAIEKLKPQVIIHSAGLVGTLALRYCRKERDAIWRVNVTGTENVLEAARRAAVAALVYTSSVAAVMDDLDSSFANVDERWPPPRSSLPYGESKV
jgi:sterol-4alpha-carboxylate 3-dehydrogenase (decarboxylating)